ncbi:ankyrin repeat domain-containing protein [Paenibacillus sacheonensis]|uniref:Ankyrin repeat domain-containing protein n=1 Tax=Paenibacillus sacheonensis TaxID=742054 RepID=A0A7X4YRR9_9BACL|nr:ankyrin repeat domain-containing protein [Paenibacillus sacheonensis]MBM7567607.1 ankyrin repeat protein [Paenibacillus sacheonensis]NBC71290.1 ankyrin repeat domain-containing protein [Paenibacillus sacheonensis]
MAGKKKSMVLSVRLGGDALEAVDLLVEAGLESNRSRAVAHLLAVGIGASEDLLGKARSLADQVKRLRSEMVEAVKEGRADTVSALLQQDASLANARNDSGETAVLMAAYYRSSAIKELLLDHGAELGAFEAAAVGSTQRVAEWLAKSPELIGAYSNDGYTMLGLAAHFGSEEAARFLLERGADVDARSRDGNLNNMAIHAAIAGNYEHIVRLLLDHGADVHAVCEGKWRLGYTPLHVAAYFGRSPMIPLLLEAGADRAALTDDGRTAAELAVMREHPAAAALLQA